MLTIRDLKKTVGGRTLFENASLQVNYGDRVALVGEHDFSSFRAAECQAKSPVKTLTGFSENA